MKVLIFIPTYNEAGNIVELLNEILKTGSDWHVLVVDDNSPDGTAERIRACFGSEPRVHLVVRKTNRGRGRAGIAGFQRALEEDVDVIVEMDGDFSHSPRFIHQMIGSLEGNCDLVIGSRFVEGGHDKERGFLRSLISVLARKYISLTLGVRLKDPTSGFRVFRCHTLKKILPHLQAADPFIIAESLYWTGRYRFRIREIPIYFFNRREGKSKLNFKILVAYLVKILFLRLRGMWVSVDDESRG